MSWTRTSSQARGEENSPRPPLEGLGERHSGRVGEFPQNVSTRLVFVVVPRSSPPQKQKTVGKQKNCHIPALGGCYAHGAVLATSVRNTCPRVGLGPRAVGVTFGQPQLPDISRMTGVTCASFSRLFLEVLPGLHTADASVLRLCFHTGLWVGGWWWGPCRSYTLSLVSPLSQDQLTVADSLV